jgi:hypothetical protein
MFVVVYLWQGERHTHSRTFDTHREALCLAQTMQAEGWQAWVERR